MEILAGDVTSLKHLIDEQNESIEDVMMLIGDQSEYMTDADDVVIATEIYE